MAPATRLQRFGSKRGLLLALVRQSIDSVPSAFDRVRASHASPLDAAVAAASHVAEHVRTPDELANNLAFFQLDLSDGDFHRLALEHSRRRARYKRWPRARCSTGRFTGRAVAPCLRGDLEALIAPYRCRLPVRRGKWT
jgi:hypothetical protein